MDSQGEKPKWLSSFKEGDFVLLVGEGDFSFAAFLIQNTKAHIIATALHSPQYVLTEKQNENISAIKDCGGSVYINVDATNLSSHCEICKEKYRAIIFNFPHIPGKMKISSNRDLLKKFFISAKEVLARDGEVYVTLCKGQGGTAADVNSREWQNTWQITAMAAFSDFILHHVEPFHVEDHPQYSCSGYRGQEKSFHTDGALMHIFKQGRPVVKDLEFVSTNQQSHGTTEEYFPFMETFIELCRKYKSLFQSSDHPVAETLTSLSNEIRESSGTYVEKITSSLLITCLGTRCIKRCFKEAAAPERLSCLVNFILYSTDSLLEEVDHMLKTGCNLVFIHGHSCCPQNLSAAELPLSCSAVLFSSNMHALISQTLMMLNRIICNEKYAEVAQDTYSTGVPHETEQKGLEFNCLRGCKDSVDCIHLEENGIKYKAIGSMLASYKIVPAGSYSVYEDICVTFVDSSEEDMNEGKEKNVLKLGNLYAISYNHNIIFCICLVIEHISMMKFHILNKALLLSDLAYLVTHVHNGESHVIYRSPSLYPPQYVHDTSFWISDGFEENKLLLFVKSVIGDLICDVKLIDTYCDEASQRTSFCYRVVYQSFDRPLSKDSARNIHTNFIRNYLHQFFNVELR